MSYKIKRDTYHCGRKRYIIYSEIFSTCSQHVKFTSINSQEFHAYISYMPTHMLGNDMHVRAMKIVSNYFLHVAIMYFYSYQFEKTSVMHVSLLSTMVHRKCFVTQDGPLGTSNSRPKQLPKSECGSLFAFFPRNEAHELWAGIRQELGGFRVGGPKFKLRGLCDFAVH